jgi:hypothetical protein
MNKFKKRIAKTISKSFDDALVIGNGLGNMDKIIESFNTVFHYSVISYDYRAKNYVIKKDLSTVINIPSISTIFIDLDYIKIFDHISVALSGSRPDLIVEGKDVIAKTHTLNLYRHNYRAIAQSEDFHVWSYLECPSR